jgi:hypothetical protein
MRRLPRWPARARVAPASGLFGFARTVGAEQRAGDRAHGRTCCIVEHVVQLAVDPAVDQLLRRGVHLARVARDLRAVEGRHRHPALAAPDPALRKNQAVAEDRRADALRVALAVVHTVLQHLFDVRRLGEQHHRLQRPWRLEVHHRS